MRSQAQSESEDPTLCSVVVVKWKDFLHVVKGVGGWKSEGKGRFFFTSNYNACLHYEIVFGFSKISINVY